MKYYNNKVIIGIDHGYGNIKTANHTFKAGVAAFDSEPVFQTNILNQMEYRKLKQFIEYGEKRIKDLDKLISGAYSD